MIEMENLLEVLLRGENWPSQALCGSPRRIAMESGSHWPSKGAGGTWGDRLGGGGLAVIILVCRGSSRVKGQNRNPDIRNI